LLDAGGVDMGFFFLIIVFRCGFEVEVEF